ncbi:MAG: phage major capsid protein [Acidovorax defluvii]
MHSTTIKPAEILAAAPDFFALQMGAAPSNTTHPLAESLSARKIAHAIGAKLRKPTDTEGDMAVMARGLRSADFARLLADGAKNVTIAAFDAAAQEHLQFAAVTPVEGFKAETLPAIDGDLDMQPMSEFAEIAHGAAFTAAGGAAVQLTTFGRIVWASRHLIINDQLDALKTVFAAVGAHAAQKEAAIVVATLNTNPLMDDAGPMFSDSNTIKAALDGTSLGLSMGTLRNQTSAAGSALNLRAAHIIVAPELEYAARKAVLDAGLDLKVAALAGLPAARWFLLPDPAFHPVLTVLRLFGSPSPLRLEHKVSFDTDGTGIRVTADLGAAFLRRTGIVRGGADLA